MSDDVFISYIVPCYNIQDYLPRCLDSLSIQNIEEDEKIEFVLVNDGSSDNSLEVLMNFAAEDKRAVVINQKNKGVSAARNAGIKAAKGKYVFFLDGDDYLMDNASQIIYDVASGSNIIILNAYIVKDGEWNVKKDWNSCGKMKDGIYDIEKFITSTQVLPISFKAYSREFLINNNILYDEDLRVGEVYTFFLHALLYTQSVLISNERVMNYVKRENSIMRDYNIKRDESILETISRINLYAQQSGINLIKTYSYNAAFLRIVNSFTLNKYVRQCAYTKEIGNLLDKVKRNVVYREVLKYFVFSCPKFNKNTFYSIGLLYLNNRFFYMIVSFLIDIKEYRKINRECKGNIR